MGYEKYLNENTVVIVGNGINRLIDNHFNWEEILHEINPDKSMYAPEGYNLTEYFEIIKVKYSSIKDPKSLFRDKIRNISYHKAHVDLVSNCQSTNTNILTTNFDHAIQKSSRFKESTFRKLKKGFTRHYPWQRFYTLPNREDSIKLWHINGDAEYIDSIKLSVSEYAGNINHFRGFDPLRNKSRFLKDYTWINELMNKRLLIFGFGLAEYETFIRNVLIIRSKYNEVRNIRHDDVFLMCEHEVNNDNFKKLNYYLISVGIRVDSTYKTYYEIYNYEKKEDLINEVVT